MPEPTNNELGIMLKNLHTTVDGGLSRISDHLKMLNGKVAEHEKWKLHNEKPLETLCDDRENKFKRYGDMVWKVATTIVLAVFGLSKFYK